MNNEEIKRLRLALDEGQAMSIEEQRRVLNDLGRANRVILAFKRSVEPVNWPSIAGEKNLR